MRIDPKAMSASRRQLLKGVGAAAVAAPAFTIAGRLSGGAHAQDATPATGPAPSASPAAVVSGDWPTFGYDYWQTRHVPFDQITKDNVSDLGIAWRIDFQEEDDTILPGNQCFPIVVDGIAYVSTTYSHVFAIDVKSGKVLWHWQPDNVGFFKNFGVSANRGVAVGDGKVFIMSLDMHLYSIDQKTGELIGDLLISDVVPDAKAEYGYYESTAPIYYDGNVYFGTSGSDNGVRGFFMAVKADDLSPAWPDPFWIVPPDGQDWRKDGANHGGGAPWMPGTVDPETNILYFVTGNPSPDFFGGVRPGNNENTNSIIAVDVKTGEQIWVAQTIGHDQWDYDMAAPPVLFMATVAGEERKVVAEGSKGGQWWAWDAATGEVLYDGIAFSKIDHPEPTEEGVEVWPGVLGGSNYAPQSYDPTTNYYLICDIEAPVVLKLATEDATERRGRGDVDFGGTYTFPSDVKPAGAIVAIDLETGQIAYKIPTPGMLRSGFTTTATGLGFYGGTTFEDANIHAIDTQTGKDLWTFGVGNDVGAAPSIVVVDGEEYVLQTVGGTGTSLIAFKLGGDKTQLPAPPPPSAEVQPAPTNPNDFLVTNANKEHSVILNLVADFSEANSGLNFNGWSKGDATVTVPTGWEVILNLWNPSAMPHSAMLTTEEVLKQGSNFTEAIQAAYTPDPTVGFTGDQTQHWGSPFGYVKMSVPGKYVILCAVPGHASAGMWFYFEVKDDATTPSVTTADGTKPAKTQG
jgi:PQQ-dependent dehydrogenase (methanol/ethanol family)